MLASGSPRTKPPSFATRSRSGFILFGRNVETRDQLRALTDSLRDLTGRDDLPVLVDQEGGPVARLRPPEWPAFPAGPAFDRLYQVAPMSAIQAMRANGEALGLMLSEVGITVDCAPILDVSRPGTTEAISRRAYGAEPMQVAALGRAMLEGLAAGGVIGVVKHMPGHGLAQVDTHHLLPTVTASAQELEVDLEPFRTLAHAPMGMTSHIVFEAWDAEQPATLSRIIIEEVIRGRIGFDGLLMTDDIDMKALSGTTRRQGCRRDRRRVRRGTRLLGADGRNDGDCRSPRRCVARDARSTGSSEGKPDDAEWRYDGTDRAP